MELFDEFLVRLAERNLQVFVISGNHDSPERLAFGGRLMDASGVHLAPVYKGRVEPITLQDFFGPVNIYMLPFVKPAHVRRFFPEAEIESYTDALRVAIGDMMPNDTERNILLAHQFVTGAERSESEEVSVGGLDNVDAAVFEGFDYAALGHIHGPQNRHEKSVTVVELGEKGTLSIRTVPLTPLHDMVELRGRYEELMSRSFYENTSYQTDYVHITLTDEADVPEAMARLRTVYQNLMKLSYDNARTRHLSQIDRAENVEAKAPMEVFAEFYAKQNGTELTEEQVALLQGLIEKIWEGEA